VAVFITVPATPETKGFSASSVQIYASKIEIFGMGGRDGIKASAYCSMRNWNTPRIFRPSVRVGAHRAINSGGMAPLRRWAQRSKIACIFTVFQAITMLASRLSASATA
jgi:hypothetical protein